MTHTTVTIQRLAIQAPTGIEQPSVRIERLLELINWQPPGYRAGQVWVIRRLANLPALHDGHEHAWIAAVEQRLDHLFRHALRVRPGISPDSHAESLLFEDRADWLALLITDIVGGRMQARWYWQELLAACSARTPGALLTIIWSRFPEYVPAALNQLPPAQAQRAVALLKPAEISRIVRALHERYALPVEIFNVMLPEIPTGAPPTAPWEPWTLPLSNALIPQAGYLYGLVQTLHHAPGYARSIDFARRAAAWIEHRLGAEQASLPVADPHNPAHRSGMSRSVAEQPMLIVETPIERYDRNNTESAGMAKKPAMQDAPPAAVRDTDGMQGTAFGGMFFLIHALAWLDLPEQQNEQIGGWAWIELFARALLGGAPDDPIWEILRRLDRRAPDTRIGAGWAPGEFRLSPRTVQRYLSGGWCSSVQDGRVRLTCGGVLVLDIPIPVGNAHPVLSDELHRYVDPAVIEPCTIPAPADIPALHAIADPGVIGQVACALPCLLHLLRRGFGDPELPTPEIAQRLLHHKGYVTVTRTHIDLFLPLDSADILLRRMGLDRNPGWRPDYGYIIAFHYG